MVRVTGIEPVRGFAPRDFKSLASACSTTLARRSNILTFWKSNVNRFRAFGGAVFCSHFEKSPKNHLINLVNNPTLATSSVVKTSAEAIASPSSKASILPTGVPSFTGALRYS